MTIAELNAAMAALVDAAEGESRSLTDEEVATYEKYEGELQSAIKTEDIKKRQATYRSPILVPNIIRATPKGDAAEEYAFEQYLRTGQRNSDLTPATYAQTEGTPSQGGYAVPDGFLARFTEGKSKFGGFMAAAENITTSDGRPLQWPSIVAENDDAADIAAEGAATAAGEDLVFDEVTLGAYKYTSAGASNLPLKVSVELLQDASFDVGAFTSRRLGERIARKQAKDLMRGSGSGAPLGIMYGTGGTIESDIVDIEDLNNLVHALDPAYRESASWVFNDTTAALIEGILDTNGRPILVNSTQGAEARITRPTLLGYPVIIDQAAFNMDSTDNVIGIAFGDFKSAYIVRHVKGVSVLVNPYAVTGYVVYDAWARMDGNVQDAAAYVTGEGV